MAHADNRRVPPILASSDRWAVSQAAACRETGGGGFGGLRLAGGFSIGAAFGGGFSGGGARASIGHCIGGIVGASGQCGGFA